MKKSLITIILLFSIFPLCGNRLLKINGFEESDLSYVNKQYDSDESNSDSYVII